MIASLFSGRRADRFYKIIAVGYVGITTLGIIITFLLIYAWKGFADLPHALGGPGARCATLDLDVAGRSRTTIDDLAAIRDSVPSTTFRTRPVELLLETDRYSYVRWTPTASADKPYARINTKEIRATFDCAQR